MLNDPAYAWNESRRPTSFGIISLLGDEQALLIESVLRKRLSPDVFEKHRLLCGNAAQLQGDEQDVVFLSMVDGSRTTANFLAVMRNRNICIRNTTTSR